MQEPKTRRIVEVLIHIIGWGIVFAFPFLLMNRSGFTVSWVDYLRHGSAVPISFLIVFYINYCFFIPRFLFEGRIKQYVLLNLLLILCTATGVHFWQDFIFHTYVKSTPPQTSRTSQLDIYPARRILNGSHCWSGGCNPHEWSLGKSGGCPSGSREKPYRS